MTNTKDTVPTKNLLESYLGKRFEFKYHMSERTAREIESYINTIGLHKDTHSATKPYLVNSLYFDTPTLNDYREKDGSFLVRKKLRARTYEENWYEGPQRVWLEVKRKRNMNITKSRVEIKPEHWQKLIEPHTNLGAIDFTGTKEEETDFNAFMYHFKRELYRPHVIIKYFRTAYLSSFTSPVRITFDRDVRICRTNHLMGERFMTPVSQNLVVMEVKFNHKLPWWFREIINRHDLRRDDFSKYRNSVAVLRGYNRIQIDK